MWAGTSTLIITRIGGSTGHEIETIIHGRRKTVLEGSRDQSVTEQKITVILSVIIMITKVIPESI